MEEIPLLRELGEGSMEWREEEGEAVTGGRVTNLGHDLRDGDQFVGTTGEFIAAFN